MEPINMEKGPLARMLDTITGKKSHERGFSFKTPEGAAAVANLARLATREVTLEELSDDRYGVEPDGSLRLDVDQETFELLSRGR
jgi:hypothetical protein